MSVSRSTVEQLGRRVYLDANLYIYLFEGVSAHRETMRELVAEIDRRDIAVIASELMFAELLPRPLREGRRDVVERYFDLMQRTPRITLASVDRRVILRAVRLRADFGLRSMDALHLATALGHDCRTFLTNDRRLASVDDLRVLMLRDLDGGP